ncbi:MAG: UbiD family decarboxylase [Desulfobacteraceae bacterium]
MQQGIRDCLSRLGSENLLLTIKKPVDPEFEVPAVMQAAEKKGKALLFEDVKRPGFRLANNVFGTRKAAAAFWGTKREQVVLEWMNRVKKPVQPIEVQSSPVKEIMQKGDRVNLEDLPIVTHCGKDAGPYITAGMVVAKDPDTGIRNVSVNRMQLKGKNKLGIRMMPPQHLGLIHEKSEKRGRNLEIAVAIGNHPFDILAAVSSPRYGEDEFTIAGALRKEPLELIKCETVDLEVPAAAEIVLEGEVLAGVREAEGPFGDFMQYYVPVMENHVFMVKAITYRADAVYQTIQAGSLEDTQYLALSREAVVYEAASHAADVLAVSLVPTILGCAVSINKRSEKDPRNVIEAAFGAYSWLKYCVVVDHDVDVFDIKDIWWAINTRSRPDKLLLLKEKNDGFPRDPFHIHQSKLGIDATAPLDQWGEFERKTVPEADDINLEDYVSVVDS